jgi:hypothetical protein
MNKLVISFQKVALNSTQTIANDLLNRMPIHNIKFFKKTIRW